MLIINTDIGSVHKTGSREVGSINDFAAVQDETVEQYRARLRATFKRCLGAQQRMYFLSRFCGEAIYRGPMAEQAREILLALNRSTPDRAAP